MFTGIVEAMANVVQKTESQLVLERPQTFSDIQLGSSIAISGTCLSVVAFDDTTMTFDVVPETWEKTNLGTKTEGTHVNLERALRADARFEGHIVQGHIEDAWNILDLYKEDDSGRLRVELPSAYASFVIPKGSITIDGVSLTVAHTEEGFFEVALIPHTIENTTLGTLQKGDKVNIETDVFQRIVYTMVSNTHGDY